MKESKIQQFENRLWTVRQAKQILASLTIGVFTCVFLDSIQVLSSVLHSLNSKALLPYLILFVVYSISGAFGLGVLARYAFIRHMKRVEADIEQVWVSKKLVKASTASKPVFKLVRGPVRQHDTNFEPSRQLRRA